MAHNLEIINGQASFASRRVPAWHSLGTVFQNDVTTSEMLELANLDNWNVRVEDIPMPEGYTSENPSFWVVRNHPSDGHSDVLATVGKRYAAFQNEDLFAFGDALLDGGRWETAGSIKDGRVVFGSLALDHEIVIDPNGVGDKINTYIMVTTSHDGSLSIQAHNTNVRVVCQNTHTIALKGSKQSYKIRHTQSAEGRIAAAREALGIAHAYNEAFEAEAKSLYETKVNDKMWYKIIETAYPKPETDTKGSFVKWDTKVMELESIYRGDTNFMIADTAWGAYNALTERLDWYRNPRGGNVESVRSAASGFDVATNTEKQRLLQVVKSLAFA
jgi:phage/plasmid-like protein (TIGR03299 family)